MNNFAERLLFLPRPAKRILAMLADISICAISVWVAFCIINDQWIAISSAQLTVVLISLCIALPLFICFGLYRAIFRYSGMRALEAMLKAIGVYTIIFAAYISTQDVPGVPRGVGMMQPILLFGLVAASRIIVRYTLGGQYKKRSATRLVSETLIYGAGHTGRNLANALADSGEIVVAGFLDDDPALQGNSIEGLKIFNPSNLPSLIHRLQVKEVILAMPSACMDKRNKIIAELQPLGLRVRTVGRFENWIHAQGTSPAVQELEIDDLLGRSPVEADPRLLRKSIEQKVVMVSGAGGSIGSELCRQIAAIGPSTLLLVEICEYALYSVHRNLCELLGAKVGTDVKVVPLLASVLNPERIDEIMRTWHPDTVFHAAAYKHVPLVEQNPVEGIRNNAFGTLIAAQAAIKNGVSSFLLISSDKAVRPTNVMGGSKRLAEMILQALSASPEISGKTKMSMVRFGNVLDSSGSVVPLFRHQIRNGGPITVTDENVTRYFMTVREAVELVIQAEAMAEGGDVYVLDMGEPVRILNLARRMVELSALAIRDEEHPDGDIEIRLTGLRPGEKLYEELLIGECPERTAHSRIMKAHEECMSWRALSEKLVSLQVALELNDVDVVRGMLKSLVSGYCPAGAVADWIHLEQLTELQNDIAK